MYLQYLDNVAWISLEKQGIRNASIYFCATVEILRNCSPLQENNNFLTSRHDYSIVVFSVNHVDLSDVMSTCQIIMFTCKIIMSTCQIFRWLGRCYDDLSDNFFVICMALIWQEHIFKIDFLTNEQVTINNKILQFYIKIWLDDIKIWKVNIFI